jgi:hypothetical protein
MKICTHSLHCLVQFLLSSHCLFISVVGSEACFYLWQSRDGIPSISCSQGRNEGVLKGGGGGGGGARGGGGGGGNPQTFLELTYWWKIGLAINLENYGNNSITKF